MSIHRFITLLCLFILMVAIAPSCGNDKPLVKKSLVEKYTVGMGIPVGNHNYKRSKRRRGRGHKRYKRKRKKNRPVGTKSYRESDVISPGTKGFSEEDETVAARNNDSNQPQNREQYGKYIENPRTSPRKEPVSTFSIDVDTGSYTNTRRFLTRQKRLPPPDSVRIEEFINYFTYQYPIPKGRTPFSIHYELAPSPFDSNRYLLHIGLQGKKPKGQDHHCGLRRSRRTCPPTHERIQ